METPRFVMSKVFPSYVPCLYTTAEFAWDNCLAVIKSTAEVNAYSLSEVIVDMKMLSALYICCIWSKFLSNDVTSASFIRPCNKIDADFVTLRNDVCYDVA